MTTTAKRRRGDETPAATLARLDRLKEAYNFDSVREMLDEVENAVARSRGRPGRRELALKQEENQDALLKQLFPKHRSEVAKRLVHAPRSHVRLSVTIHVTKETKDELARLAESVGMTGAGPIARLLMIGGYGAVRESGLANMKWIEKWADGQIL